MESGPLNSKPPNFCRFGSGSGSGYEKIKSDPDQAKLNKSFRSESPSRHIFSFHIIHMVIDQLTCYYMVRSADV